MTDQEILDEIADQLSNTQIPTKILRWVNSYIYALAGRFTFPHLRSSDQFTMQIGVQSYPLNTSLYYMKNVWTSLRKLDPGNELDIANADYLWNTQQGQVIKYILYGRTILLYQLPANSTEIVYYSFQSRPTAFVAGKNTEYLGFPIEWHPVLTQGALVKGFKYEGSPQYASALIELKDMERELYPTIHRRPDVRNVFGSGDGGGRRMAPATLDPSHYANR